MTSPSPSRASRIRASEVALLAERVILGGDSRSDEAITVAPLVEGKRIRSLDIRCTCGQRLRLECVYATEDDEPAQAPPPQQEE